MSDVQKVIGVFLLCLLASGLTVSAAETKSKSDKKPSAADLDFFEKKVRPILVERCYSCHAAEAKKVKGGLYLDTRDGWVNGGDSGPALVEGKPDQSLIIQAIRYEDEDLQMPPKRKLPPDEIAALELWVATGAADPRTGKTIDKPKKYEIDVEAARRTWTFQTPKVYPAPAVKDQAWPNTDIDRFILSALEAKNLKPAPDADRFTLIRRLTYDLTGLPPTPKQIEAFVTDKSSDAWTKVVDRLLKSPRFGEHWGRHWLDVARYADTNGSDFNATFYNAWRYRQFVIESFNQDKPYDLFVRQQVAGDLMPAEDEKQATKQIIATGFLALAPKMLSERDKERLRMDVVDEQIDTIGRVFMGMTLGCARCHDHKFDPIATRDYYALAGILRSTTTIQGEMQQYVSSWVQRPLPVSQEHRDAIAAYNKASKVLKDEIKKSKKKIEVARKSIASNPMKRLGIVVDDREAKLVGAWKKSTYSPHYVGVGYIHDEKKDKGKKSVTWVPDLPEAGVYEVRIAYASSAGRSQKVPVTIKYADGQKQLTVDQVPRPPINHLFRPLGRFRFEKGKSGFVSISTEGTDDGYVIADAAQFIPVRLLEAKKDKAPAAKKKGPGPRTESVTKDHMVASEAMKRLTRLEKQLAELDKDKPKPIPTAIAVKDAEQVADCRVRIRGETRNLGPSVKRGFIRAASSDDATITQPERSGRLELAHWLTRPDHPLTGRVMVNRIWYHLMGAGIVSSVDNFGVLGQKPTHPQLLDTLATRFVKDGYSIKGMIRRIVMSRAYRMSTTFDQNSYQADPENELLWRAHRKRLTAESIRDSMLAVSGQLDLTPSVEPVKGLAKIAVNNSAQSAIGVDLLKNKRRTVYLPIIRGGLPSILTVFDFADPDMVVGRRPVTTVPAQALLLMNSPFVVQSAKLTTMRLLARPNSREVDNARLIDRAYLLTLNRYPDEAERDQMLKYLNAQLNRQVAEGAVDDKHRAEVWARIVQVLFASTEFRTLN